ncbi:hypothetical protein GAV44_23280 [Salmonella enterica subsp. enterica serovar Newport]|nr:hypothetical protein [Salmonella enterica subsp. enterica serovar Newport]
MKKLMIVAAIAVALSGCTSQASRIADCQAEGISRDACYMAEKDRQNSINAAAAEKQALENAAQIAQSAHKKGKGTTVKHYQGLEIARDKAGIVKIDGLPALPIETNDKAIVYQQGLHKFVWYTNGKVAVLENDVFQGWAK